MYYKITKKGSKTPIAGGTHCNGIEEEKIRFMKSEILMEDKEAIEYFDKHYNLIISEEW